MTNKPKNVHSSSKKPPRRLSKFLRKYLEEEDGSEGENNTVCSHEKHDAFAAIIKASESDVHFSSKKPKHGPFKPLMKFLNDNWTENDYNDIYR